MACVGSRLQRLGLVRLVQINNATLMAGEVAHVKVQDRDVVVYCKEIRDDSVLITADDKPMELKLGRH